MELVGQGTKRSHEDRGPREANGKEEKGESVGRWTEAELAGQKTKMELVGQISMGSQWEKQSLRDGDPRWNQEDQMAKRSQWDRVTRMSWMDG